MIKEQSIHFNKDIEFRVVYSGRRTIGISVLPDSSVVVRAPYLTTQKTINRLVQEKAAWIIKHRDRYKGKEHTKIKRQYINGEIHLFRGRESVLNIRKSDRPFVLFNDSVIEIGLNRTEDPQIVKWLLYQGYKNEARKIFPDLLKEVLRKYEDQMFRPAGLIIRTMKSRWGSCSHKGKITLSTELIKLSDVYIEYVILHELCHLRHHNHGAGYYKLLSELYPEWKTVRKDLRRYIQ
jgi:predicted metal-dependent hydrolase